MFVKVYKEGRKHAYYPCEHIDVEERTQDKEIDGVKYKAGIVIQVCGVGSDRKGTVNVHMPKDGDVVYVENDRGDTIGTYRWPIKDKNSGTDHSTNRSSSPESISTSTSSTSISSPTSTTSSPTPVTMHHTEATSHGR